MSAFDEDLTSSGQQKILDKLNDIRKRILTERKWNGPDLDNTLLAIGKGSLSLNVKKEERRILDIENLINSIVAIENEIMGMIDESSDIVKLVESEQQNRKRKNNDKISENIQKLEELNRQVDLNYEKYMKFINYVNSITDKSDPRIHDRLKINNPPEQESLQRTTNKRVKPNTLESQTPSPSDNMSISPENARSTQEFGLPVPKKTENSPNYSIQGHYGTCYSHSATRVLLNDLRHIVPKYFYPLPDDDCSDVYDERRKFNLETLRRCSEKSSNNMLMFYFILSLTSNTYGYCGIDYQDEVFNRVISNLYSPEDMRTGTRENLIRHYMSVYDNVEHKHIQRIDEILKEYNKRSVIPQIVHMDKLNSPAEYNKLVRSIKDAVKKGQYLTAISQTHIITVVGCYTKKGVLYVSIKNSWGNSSTGKLWDYSQNVDLSDPAITSAPLNELLGLNIGIGQLRTPANSYTEFMYIDRSGEKYYDAAIRRVHRNTLAELVSKIPKKHGGIRTRKRNSRRRRSKKTYLI